MTEQPSETEPVTATMQTVRLDRLLEHEGVLDPLRMAREACGE